MKNKTILLLLLVIVCRGRIIAQVPVREEPRHHPVLQNKYIRLLDIWLPPGDTSLYHIHATPSLFIYLSRAVIGSQIKGEGWIKDLATPGKTWYRSFSPEVLVHRVCNLDSITFHVNDIEILSSYAVPGVSPKKPLSYTLLFESEKAFAYQLTEDSFNKKIIDNRGPMIAELVTGSALFFYETKTKQSKEIKTGKYFYIEPGASFYFTQESKEPISLVLFEIR
jgi:hypothetical protein